MDSDLSIKIQQKIADLVKKISRSAKEIERTFGGSEEKC